LNVSRHQVVNGYWNPTFCGLLRRKVRVLRHDGYSVSTTRVLSYGIGRCYDDVEGDIPNGESTGAKSEISPQAGPLLAEGSED
jgi:hypothetical protein